VLNLIILSLALLLGLGAVFHRKQLDNKFERILDRSQSTPGEINAIRTELADLNLTEQALAKELDSRLGYIEQQKTKGFYIAIDTSRKTFHFNYGDDIVREATVQIGPPANVVAPDGNRSWTFVPLRGEFAIREKLEGMEWRVPSWLYAMNGQPEPADRPVIEDGLGKYVIVLPNNYIIHSPPSPESPLKGPKPGSFMVPEEDLAAIWPRLSSETRVFVF
jgi:hypothetical protein